MNFVIRKSKLKKLRDHKVVPVMSHTLNLLLLFSFLWIIVTNNKRGGAV